MFFLLCFLASFSASTYKSIYSKVSSCNISHNKISSVSSKVDCNLSDNEFLFEENETNSENDFQVQAILLPFFVSFFQNEVSQPTFTSAAPLAVKQSNPIYIEVCNFRI